MLDQRAWMNRVEKPARYIGREYNSVVKDPAGKIRYAFCFPDVYEVGMSHLGTKILYHTMNEREDTYCERVFAPWVDMEKYLRETKTPLWTLETGTPLAEMDLIGFTLQYEMTYTNLLNMLELGGVPLLARDRKNGPFVMAGGPVAMNAEPLSDFVDFFVLGDGEEMNHEVLDAYRDWKASGAPREAFLEAVAGIRGVYVPSFYDVDYDGDGVIRFVKPNHPAAPERIKKRVVWDLDSAYFPTKVIVPYTEPIHDRIMLEIFRGSQPGLQVLPSGHDLPPGAGTFPGSTDGTCRGTGEKHRLRGDLSHFSQLRRLLPPSGSGPGTYGPVLGQAGGPVLALFETGFGGEGSHW